MFVEGKTIIIRHPGVSGWPFVLNFVIRHFRKVTRWAPTIVLNEVMGPLFQWPYKWVTEVITLLIGVVTLLITGRGPPCRKEQKDPI